MVKCKHNFRAISDSSAGYQGILLYCVKCGSAYAYDEGWVLYPL
jgi:hypothetical protein